MVLLIVGVVLAIVGVILWVVKGKKEGQSAAMELAETSTVSAVMENYNSINASLGNGSFTHFVELKGKAHSDQPIKAELSQQDVVYLNKYTKHFFKEYQEKKESDGSIKMQWVKRDEVIGKTESWADDWGLKDNTGFIQIDGAKAKIETEKLTSQVEQATEESSRGLNVKIGNFKMNLGGSPRKGDRQSLHFEHIEEGIKVNTDLYVLGDANDRDGVVRVSMPTDKKQPFIVSTKSEDELLAELGSSIKGLTIGAYVCWGLGGVGVIAGVIMAVMGK